MSLNQVLFMAKGAALELPLELKKSAGTPTFVQVETQRFQRCAKILPSCRVEDGCLKGKAQTGLTMCGFLNWLKGRT